MAEDLLFDVFADPADRQIVFSGPPTRLTGTVGFQNRGSVALVLREAGIHDPSGAIGASRHTIPPLVLKPFRHKHALVKVAVSPSTEVGEYPVELRVAGQTHPAVLFITEAF